MEDQLACLRGTLQALFGTYLGPKPVIPDVYLTTYLVTSV